jgi:hypothetical protein
LATPTGRIIPFGPDPAVLAGVLVQVLLVLVMAGAVPLLDSGAIAVPVLDPDVDALAVSGIRRLRPAVRRVGGRCRAEDESSIHEQLGVTPRDLDYAMLQEAVSQHLPARCAGRARRRSGPGPRSAADAYRSAPGVGGASPPAPRTTTQPWSALIKDGSGLTAP